MTYPPPSDGPFASRQQAEAVFAHFRQAAQRGRSGPPWEQLTYTTPGFLADSLADTIDSFPGAVVAAYDRILIDRIAGLFDPVDVAVIMSWIRRAAGDRPDATTHIVNPEGWLP